MNAVPWRIGSLASSFFSVVNLIATSQDYQVQMLGGNIREPTFGYKMLYFAWTGSILCYKAIFCSLLLFWLEWNHSSNYAHDERGNDISLYYKTGAIMLLCIPINIVIHCSVLGFDCQTFLNGMLSPVIPVNFLNRDINRVKRFIFSYTLANEAIMFATIMAFVTVYYSHLSLEWDFLQFECVCLVSTSGVGFTIARLSALALFAVGLSPLYENLAICYPANLTVEDRENTFPMDWDHAELSPRELATRGHFYSDPRKNSHQTTCFACGHQKSNDDIFEPFHSPVCLHEEMDIVPDLGVNSTTATAQRDPVLAKIWILKCSRVTLTAILACQKIVQIGYITWLTIFSLTYDLGMVEYGVWYTCEYIYQVTQQNSGSLILAYCSRLSKNKRPHRTSCYLHNLHLLQPDL